MTLAWRYAVASDVGLLREGNEDAAYAGSRLLAVADGMGGHAAGEVASAAAIAALEPLDDEAGPVAPDAALRRAMDDANRHLREMVAADNELHGMGTTVTAVFRDGDESWLAHVGDSRAYLLRDGQLSQVTRDHTFVQQLIDEGRIDPQAAHTHPQRNVLTRTLDGREPLRLDVERLEFRAGDRLLLCTDGLSGVVSDESIREVLTTSTPTDAVRRLIDLALRGGGPDNITCVVAEAYDATAAPASAPQFAGAAAEAAADVAPHRDDSPAARAAALDPGAAQRRAPRRERPVETGLAAERARHLRRRRLAIVAVAVLVLLGAGATVSWSWMRSQYFIGVAGDEVVLYRGVEGEVAGIRLATVAERVGLRVDALPEYERRRVRDGIHADSRAHAVTIVARLRDEVLPSPAPSPTPGPTLTPAPSPGATRPPTPQPTGSPR